MKLNFSDFLSVVQEMPTHQENGQLHPFDHLAFNPHIYITLDSWYCCWYLHNCPSLHSLYRSVNGSHRFLAVSSTIPEILCSRDDGGKRT